MWKQPLPVEDLHFTMEFDTLSQGTIIAITESVYDGLSNSCDFIQFSMTQSGHTDGQADIFISMFFGMSDSLNRINSSKK